MEETAAKHKKKGQKSFDFEIFLEMFLRRKISKTLWAQILYRELCRYEYVRIPRKRERKTGVF